MEKREKYHLLDEKSIQEIAFEELTEYLFCLILKRYSLQKENIIRKGNYDQIDFYINNEKLTVRLVKSTRLNRLEFYLKGTQNPNVIISVGYTLEKGDLVPLDAINPLKIKRELCYPLLRIAGKSYIDKENKYYLNKKNLDLPTSPLLVDLIKSILPSFEWIERKFSCGEIKKTR